MVSLFFRLELYCNQVIRFPFYLILHLLKLCRNVAEGGVLYFETGSVEFIIAAEAYIRFDDVFFLSSKRGVA